jgi:Fe-S cluster assembly iron-binding protein IscA
MLQVTARAATLLKQERSQRGVPESFGLRIAQSESDSRSPVHLEFTEGPAPGDEVSETNGLLLFVASEIADPLTEQAIDTKEGDDGANLVIRDQADVPDDS